MKTKDRILELLKNAKDDYVSGETMADTFSISRAGIWKAIKALEKEGYLIEAVSSKGYKLVERKDAIDAAWIENELRRAGVDCRVFYYEETDSTNNRAAELGRTNPGMVLAIADKQTNGRGRRGRSFFSPLKAGIYMSLLLPTKASIEELAGFTATAAVAAATAVDAEVFSGEDETKIKWVNDLYMGDRKIAGIITEFNASLEEPGCHNLVMGIGINVYTPGMELPEDIRNKAGAIEACATKLSENVRNRIIVKTLTGLFYYFEHKEKTLELYRRKSMLTGHTVKINNFSEQEKEKEAFVTGIDDNFRLLVRYADGREDALFSGEVSVVKEN